LPPLRERAEDVPLLAEHFIDKLNRPNGKHVLGCTSETLALLSAAEFPGNVRERENEIERAWVLADDEGYITPDLLSPRFAAVAQGGLRPPETLRGKMDRFEQEAIREALDLNAWNQTRTAAALGISRRSLIDKMNKYDLSRGE
jgi:two-component system, NtrC family, response regulator HupR/HoxA